MVIQLKDPIILPKVIPLNTIEDFLATIYKQISQADTPYKRRNALRDVAVSEMLFSTGIRISDASAFKLNAAPYPLPSLSTKLQMALSVLFNP